jgi:quinol monooxygenase YgiN
MITIYRYEEINMSDPMVIFAQIQPKPQHFDEAKNAILEIIPPTRREDGCEYFALHENQADGLLCLYEQWRDQNALDAHYEMPYTARIFESYETWLDAPVEVIKLRKVA